MNNQNYKDSKIISLLVACNCFQSVAFLFSVWMLWKGYPDLSLIDSSQKPSVVQTSSTTSSKSAHLLAEQWTVFERRLLSKVDTAIAANIENSVSSENNVDDSKSKFPIDTYLDYESTQKHELSQISFDTSESLISAAIANGRWTSDDNFQLNQVLADVSAEQRRELLEIFMTALNEQKLAIEAADFPIF